MMKTQRDISVRTIKIYAKHSQKNAIDPRRLLAGKTPFEVLRDRLQSRIRNVSTSMPVQFGMSLEQRTTASVRSHSTDSRR